LSRCYLVKDWNERELRRNIIFLRKRKTLILELEEEIDKEITKNQEMIITISKKIRENK